MYKRIHIFVQIKKICKLEKMKNFYKSPQHNLCKRKNLLFEPDNFL